MKDKVTSFETFVRLPWVSWAAPKARALRHGRPDAARRRRRVDDRRRRQAARAQAVGRETLPDGGAGLTVDDATKQAAVARFLRG